jgi:hypothetical protein
VVGIKIFKRALSNLNVRKNRLLHNVLLGKNSYLDKSIVPLEDDSRHVFCYYDVSPFHPDKDILLAMKVPYRRKINVRNTETKLGLFDISERSFYEFGASASWTGSPRYRWRK